MAALKGFTNHHPAGIHHSCPVMTSRSVTVTVILLHKSASLTHTHTHPPTLQSCDAYIFTPPHYKYHYVWLYLLPSHQGCRWPTLITLIKVEMCVFFMRVCVGLWNLITPRWILISLWWDTKHQSQSTNALAANHINEYILFWPLCELFFVFHITFPWPNYSLSVLGLFCIHTLPFNSLSHPHSLCLSFSLSHPSFVLLLFNIFFPFSPLHSPLLHPQLKPGISPRSWNCCASTQSWAKSKVPVGNTRIRVASYTWRTVLVASQLPCPCPSPTTQLGTTPAP